MKKYFEKKSCLGFQTRSSWNEYMTGMTWNQCLYCFVSQKYSFYKFNSWEFYIVFIPCNIWVYTFLSLKQFIPPRIKVQAQCYLKSQIQFATSHHIIQQNMHSETYVYGKFLKFKLPGNLFIYNTIWCSINSRKMVCKAYCTYLL